MNARKAKALMKKFLDENGIGYTELKAKTVSFQDLMRDGRVFVKIFGWTPDEKNYELVKQFGKDNGFIAQPM